MAVIGHSLGGLVALELAARGPRARGPIGTGGRAGHAESVAPLSRRLAALAQPGSTMPAQSAWWPSPSCSATRCSCWTPPPCPCAATSARSPLPSTSRPWSSGASRTRSVPVEVGQRLTELIPGARLHVLPGTGHQPQWEARTPSTRRYLVPGRGLARRPTPSGIPRRGRPGPWPWSAPRYRGYRRDGTADSRRGLEVLVANLGGAHAQVGLHAATGQTHAWPMVASQVPNGCLHWFHGG